VQDWFLVCQCANMYAFAVGDSPRAPVYVVRNTFVEVADGNTCEESVEEQVPAFRRRRGSSFFRSSSEPLATAGQTRAKTGEVGDIISTEDEGSDHGMSTPEVSPASSRVPSPASGSRCPVYANLAQLPRLEPQYAPYGLHGPNVGQALLYFAAAHKSSLAFPQVEQPRPVPSGRHSSTSSDAGTVVGAKAAHLIWCDHRAFKETSSSLKDELESRSGASVKTHKTAENCIRLFRKKQRAQGRPPCVILVSWANAPALLTYLAEAQHVTTKVVVLCDARSCRKNESAEQMCSTFPFIQAIATTWDEAVGAVCDCVSSFQ